MKVEWSDSAIAALTAYADYLHEIDPELSAEARADIRQYASSLGGEIDPGRPSQWDGLRVLSVLRWKKLIVYREDTDRIVVVAFYDARQDLTKVSP